MQSAKGIVEGILHHADIHINGARPWDMVIHNEQLYERVLSVGSLGLGEAYMDKWWECEQLDEFFSRILRAQLDKAVKGDVRLLLHIAGAVILNQQRKTKAFNIGEHHYDIGNDLYQAMLDKRLTYTCGYWKNATTLDEAQEAKLDLVCKKIGLKAGQKVLDIGCGWGSFAQFAAEKYGAQVVGVTVSKEQIELGRTLCRGLPVELRLQDYREVKEPFDHVVSLGMIEHVGYKNYRTYMEVVHRVLKDEGLFLLHTIGGLRSVKTTEPWIAKYIFPNSMLPSIQQLSHAFQGLFVMEDWHSFGHYYDQTLMTWFHNFDAHWNELKQQYDDRFYRMWKYYLLCCAGSFRARKNQLWQIVLSKHGVPGGYESLR
ncbi:MAG TPA: cyclopropane fatty acyl phospholipid synthase [Patescibacteria group bacterium]|nr:cyclopropane fatty acyl phospholipid synthase [Patescibacteria group bacterium]